MRIGFDRHRSCTGITDREPRRNVGIGRHDNFVAWTYFPCAQNQVQRVKTVADTNAVTGAAIRSIFALERLDFTAQYVPTGIHRPVIRLIELGAQFDVRIAQVEKRDFHRRRIMRRNSS